MKRPLLFCLVTQLVVALIAALGLFVGFGRHYGSSFALGALIFAVANTYFAFYAFRFPLAQPGCDSNKFGHEENNAYQAVMANNSFKRGLFGKLVLSAVGFALAFRFLENMVTPLLFVGFITMIVLQVFLASIVAKQS